MSWSGTILSAPVSMADVQAAVSNTSTDLATLCKASGINKWNKNKPYSYPKIAALSTANNNDERRGIASDIENGIIYGLRCRPVNGTLNGIHSCDYEYVRKPTGGANSPYRLTDFNNYRKNAVPDISVIGITKMYEFVNPSSNDTNYKFVTVRIQRNTYNQHYVSLRDIYNPQANDATSDQPVNWYPCVMIGNRVRIMASSIRVANTTIVPTYSKLSDHCANNNNADFILDTTGLGLSNKTYPMSVLLVSRLSGTGYDFRNWTTINPNNVFTDLKSVVLPAGVGYTIGVGAAAKNAVICGAPMVSKSGFTISGFDTKDSTNYGTSKAVTFTVKARYGSTTNSVTLTKSAGVAWANFMGIATFTWSQFLIAAGTYPSNGTIYTTIRVNSEDVYDRSDTFTLSGNGII